MTRKYTMRSKQRKASNRKGSAVRRIGVVLREQQNRGLSYSNEMDKEIQERQFLAHVVTSFMVK